MEVARSNSITKGFFLSSVTGKTSCSSGWIRLMLQSIFAVITVASFILIVAMAVRGPKPGLAIRPPIPLRCYIQGCTVICNEAPYFGDYEEDIIYVVMEADSQCRRIYLTLMKPFFPNGTLPYTWLSRLHCNIYQISIIGGNLMHIPSGAFMAQFMGAVNLLILQDVRIGTFKSTSLVGLTSLRTFSIMNSWIDGVQENALRAVDDTLESLTVTDSGYWDPVVFTGSRGFEQLTIVDFSYNNFNQTLNERSFVGLILTKILYLNYCRITAIGAGTFDHLNSIEVLYLQNNMLSTVPSGLFNTIVALENPRPRINLQSNYWYCDCKSDDLRQLIRKELLLVEVKCMFPDEFSSATFTQFEYVCNNAVDTMYGYNTTNATNDTETNKVQIYSEPVYFNGKDCISNSETKTIQLITPVRSNECSNNNNLNYMNIYPLLSRDVDDSVNNKSTWLRLSYFIQSNQFSVVQIRAIKEKKNYGLIWYQSTCPHEVYCLDVIPHVLKLYEADTSAQYVFCPINLKTGHIEDDDCIDVTVEKKESSHDSNIITARVVLYIMTMLLCSCLGAVVVYGLIRRKPTLLKGSKRILFVKDKYVDALVLPPKVPLRNDLINFKDNEVFTLTSSYNDKLKPPNVKRMKSVRSNKSGSPSYISAMQPTEDQLAEWRIRHHFNNDLTISSRKSELSTLSLIEATYYSLDESDRTYESLK